MGTGRAEFACLHLIHLDHWGIGWAYLCCCPVQQIIFIDLIAVQMADSDCYLIWTSIWQHPAETERETGR